MTRVGSNASSGRLFDRILVVDWSANSAPKVGRDSIWVGCVDGDGTTWTSNVPTRTLAVEFLARAIVEDGPSRVLLAVDFSLGFPRGTAAALGLGSSDRWAAMWAMLADRVIDHPDNRNNRFELASELNREVGGGPGPFWGCPPSARSPWLTSTKVDSAPLPTWRHTEQSLRDLGHRPFSSWQLLGAGAVASQSLLGIAALRALVRRLADREEVAAHIWPFTTGLGTPLSEPGSVVVAEAWPSMIDLGDVPVDGVRDEAQVRLLARSLAGLDAGGHLDLLFAPAVGSEILDDVVGEEGWVLGAGTSFALR